MRWKDEVEELKRMSDKGMTMVQIGNAYGVSRQRVYQIFNKYNISTPERERKSVLQGKPPKYWWFSKALIRGGFSKKQRVCLLNTMEIPDRCPMLGLVLNYDGQERSGWTREDNSPSIDRIDSSKGYEQDNIQVISWRANRIKNDSTPEELKKIYDYMITLQEKT